jgi:hypothetical protein
MTLLSVEGLVKEYRRRWKTTFRLEASLTVEKPGIVGVMGPNGSGKTTLFELITGSNIPSAGRVLVAGQDIHRVKARSRDRLAIHYHQSYQVRRFRKRKPDFLLEAAKTAYPMVHLFDEPQFNTQDGYIGFMLEFFRRLRSRIGWCSCACIPPSATTSRSCGRYASASCSSTRVEFPSIRTSLRSRPTRGSLPTWDSLHEQAC